MTDSRAFALIPSRRGIPGDHSGAAYLVAAGFQIRQAINYSSVFDAYSTGLRKLLKDDKAKPNDIVLFVHDDVSFHDILPWDFGRIVRRHLALPRAGFVGVGGCRTLWQSLAWWRNASGPTALAGTVHHGTDIEKAERAFFGPPGRVAVLDGVLLAASVRTLTTHVRLDAPANLSGWHFYDISVTLQAHAAGLVNVAIPLGVLHGSKGVTDESWQKAQYALALRLYPILPAAVSTTPEPRKHKRVAVLLMSSRSEERLPGVNHNIHEIYKEAGYEVWKVTTGSRKDRDSGLVYERGTAEELTAETCHPFHWVEQARRKQENRTVRKSIACAKHLSSLELAAIDRLAVMEDDDTLVIASTHALPITPPADMDWLIEAALSVPKTFAAPLGCNEAPTCSPVEMWPADTGIFLPFNNSISVEGMRRARTGSLQLRKPAARVDRFASGGLIAGKWATFRHLHKSVGEATRQRLDVLSSKVLYDLPVDVLYSLLAQKVEVHNEVVSLISMHLRPEAMGGCTCDNTTDW